MDEPRRYAACCTDLSTTGYEKVRILLLAYDAADAIAQIGLVQHSTYSAEARQLVLVPHYAIRELRPWVQELDGPWIRDDNKREPIVSLYVRAATNLPHLGVVQRG